MKGNNVNWNEVINCTKTDESGGMKIKQNCAFSRSQKNRRKGVTHFKFEPFIIPHKSFILGNKFLVRRTHLQSYLLKYASVL